MNQFDKKLMSLWIGWGKRLLPFADAASDDLPLSRLLRLSLIQFSVGISLTLLVGTLNRVMIVELEVASTIVGVMLALAVGCPVSCAYRLPFRHASFGAGLAREDQQANVVGLMYVSLLLGSIVSALVFGAFLTDFSPGRLIQVIQGCAVVTVFLNLVRHMEAGGTQFERRMIVIGIGTLAFTMSDALLEPYGAQALGLGVGMTTRLTAILAGGSTGGGLHDRIADPQPRQRSGQACGGGRTDGPARLCDDHCRSADTIGLAVFGRRPADRIMVPLVQRAQERAGLLRGD